MCEGVKRVADHGQSVLIPVIAPWPHLDSLSTSLNTSHKPQVKMKSLKDALNPETAPAWGQVMPNLYLTAKYCPLLSLLLK